MAWIISIFRIGVGTGCSRNSVPFVWHNAPIRIWKNQGSNGIAWVWIGCSQTRTGVICVGKHSWRIGHGRPLWSRWNRLRQNGGLFKSLDSFHPQSVWAYVPSGVWRQQWYPSLWSCESDKRVWSRGAPVSYGGGGVWHCWEGGNKSLHGWTGWPDVVVIAWDSMGAAGCCMERRHRRNQWPRWTNTQWLSWVYTLSFLWWQPSCVSSIHTTQTSSRPSMATKWNSISYEDLYAAIVGLYWTQN